MFAYITEKKTGAPYSLKWWDRFEHNPGGAYFDYIGYYRSGGHAVADPISSDSYNVEIIEDITNYPSFDPSPLWLHGVPGNVSDIVTEQLEAYYGWDYFMLNGHMWRQDLYDSETEAYLDSIKGLVERAVEYRTELMLEEYGDEDSYDEEDPHIKELRVMEAYLATL